jgi:hypothetical protein
LCERKSQEVEQSKNSKFLWLKLIIFQYSSSILAVSCVSCVFWK